MFLCWAYFRQAFSTGTERLGKDQQGRSPAHLAAVYRHKNAAALLAEGADTGCDAYGHSVESILDSQAREEDKLISWNLEHRPPDGLQNLWFSRECR